MPIFNEQVWCDHMKEGLSGLMMGRPFLFIDAMPSYSSLACYSYKEKRL